jgi:BASS family bile acid:Na+ symporter
MAESQSCQGMNAHDIVSLALQGSVLLAVFSFGLQASGADMMYLLRRPGMLVRSLLAMFVIMPVLAVALALSFDFSPPAKIALVALSLSPVPPLLPRRELKAGGQKGHALGLLALAALSSIVVIPAALRVLRAFVDQPLAMSFSAIALLAITSVLLPLVAGLLLQGAAPRVARRLARPIALISSVFLVGGALTILIASRSAIVQLLGNGTLVGLALFVAAGLLVGHLLGGRDPGERSVLALSTACRHPAIALAVGTANFPEQRSVPAAILLYLIVNLLVTLPYVRHAQRRAASATSARQEFPPSADRRTAA